MAWLTGFLHQNRHFEGGSLLHQPFSKTLAAIQLA
jgi:hypothetical protein